MKKKKSIYEELEYYRLIISGALANPEVLKQLAALGYDRKAILAGQQQLLKLKSQQQGAGKRREQPEGQYAINASVLPGSRCPLPSLT